MKKFSQINEAKAKLELQDNTLNYASEKDLKTYLEICKKFISDEAKEIVNWLIVNNETYLHELDPDMEADNALAAFYDAGVPKDASKKELYKLIGTIVKRNRLIEIPVFQTKEQFNAIIKKEVNPDEILLDLESPEGRNKVAKQYTNLIMKIVNQWKGKANVDIDDLVSAANEGLVYAMNTFGKPKKRGKDGKWEDAEKNEKTLTYTFGQYAAYCIRNHIIGLEIEGSHLVRIPKSQQKKERETKGSNTKSTSVSGDQTIGHDNEGNGRTLFDMIGGLEDAGKDLAMQDFMKLFDRAYKKLEGKFSKEDMEIFYKRFGLNDYKTTPQKDLAKEYNMPTSTINNHIYKIIQFIKKDKELSAVFAEIWELMAEAKQTKYEEEDNLTEAKHLPNNIKLNED